MFLAVGRGQIETGRGVDKARRGSQKLPKSAAAYVRENVLAGKDRGDGNSLRIQHFHHCWNESGRGTRNFNYGGDDVDYWSPRHTWAAGVILSK